MEFIQRLKAPGATDKLWLHTSCGGLNDCIKIGGKSVLPNCVGYAFGRFMELLNSYPNLSKGNAEIWYGKMDGYERGQTPRLGAVCCFSKGIVGNGGDGAGHVCVVEAIEEDGTILTSNSAYGGTRFYTKSIKPPYRLNGYNFQGFIYLPIEFENASLYDKLNYKDQDSSIILPTELKPLNEIAKEVIQGKWGNGETRKANLEVAGYDYYKVQALVNEAFNIKNNENKQEDVSVENAPETPVQEPLKYKVGDRVNFDYLYIDSYASKKLKSAKHSGTITKIYYGRKAPYLIDHIVGFLNDDLIIN